MTAPRSYFCIATMLLGISVGFRLPSAFAAEECEEWLIKVVSVQGTVQARKPGETRWIEAAFGDTYCSGAVLRVRERSRATVYLSNDGTLHLDQNTTATFSGIVEKRTTLLEVLIGAIHFFSRKAQSINITTPFVNAGVKGTEAFVRVEADRALLTVFEGRLAAANDEGTLSIGRNQSAVAIVGQAPVLRTVVRPRDAVQWALYYPPLLDTSPADVPGGPNWQGMVRRSIEAYRDGDLVRAFSALEDAPEDIRDPGFFTYHAGLLLAVGRVEEAESDIERALGLDPNHAEAVGLQAVIAVVHNEKDKALGLAKRAVELDPESSTAKVALSYAQQARFDLDGALRSLQEAVELAPRNALAQARLAELQLSVGELDRALKTARKAVSLNPHLARTHSVLGFAFLTQVKTREAKDAFMNAIELDQADPLSRLGLGLAKIRDGDVKGGRTEIEIAASLDPNNSLIRSYLGKAYFEEKRDKHSMNQYAAAKELDPSDPTPWFYDAIRKQTVNRPVEALHDLQKSIALNDNRAVYRSRLQLDEDLAARSASLGRIYRDLGFEQLALVEGWKSVNTDPSNYSAHRFLADSYSARPRHEIARVSELLQSQLLQPINVTPVQPSLAEANPFILEGAGPADPAFNEFNSMFLRNRLALQASGIVGENDTLGDEIVQSGLYGRFSYSLGQFYYDTDGFRKNSDLEREIYNVFSQASLSHKTSLQAEYRYDDTKKGDLALRFDPDDFFPNLHETRDSRSIRLGVRHSFLPTSDLIGSFIYEDVDSSLKNSIGASTFDSEGDEDSYSAETQYLFRSELFNFVTGGGYFDIDRKIKVTRTAVIPVPFPPFSLTSTETTNRDSDIDHANLYLYSKVTCLKNATFTIGASADFFDGGIVDRKQFNPKLGVNWIPVPGTTLRGAVFRTLKRTLIANQTLEPTQVAGFNQFFDDGEGTESWRYGVAIDQKVFKSAYGGIEYSMRDLEVPFEDIPPPPAPPAPPPAPSVRRVDWEERLARAYFYWTPKSWLATSVEFEYEEFERDRDFVAGIKHVDTYRVPLAVRFYHPCGFNAGLKATYTDQDGKFQPQGSGPGTFVSGDDRFWTVDASLGYRLPKRLGLATVEATNLFDESFKYYDTDPVSPAIQPDRSVFFKLTLAF